MNSHIKEACEQFITQVVNPEYAIMINGPWGCGKTYLIKELQKESWLKNTKGKNENKVVKISLYGVISKEDIETQLFYAVYKILDNDIVKNFGTAFSSLLDSKLNIDSKTIMSMCFKDWSKQVKVIIVDDLERTCMPVYEILGYFYNYIIEQDIRIIFIGNEDEIKDAKGDHDKKYIRTKEKVIGEVYTVQPQIEDAIKTFLEPERRIETVIPKEMAIAICIKVVSILKIENLRIIWQGLVRVQRLMNAIIECEAYRSVQFPDDDYSDSDNTKLDYLSEIFELYLVLYLQISTGEVTKYNVGVKAEDGHSVLMDVIGVYKNERCGIAYLSEKEAKEDSLISDKQLSKDKLFSRRLTRIPLGFVALQSSEGSGDKLWYDYLFHSKIDKKILKSVIEEDKQWFSPQKNAKSNLYKLISSSLMMEQDDFDVCYRNVIDEFKQGKYVEVGELIHGYSLCITYNEYGVIKYNAGEIKDLFDLVLSNTVINVDMHLDYGHVFHRGYMGYAYSSDMIIGEGKEFVDKLRILVDEKRMSESKYAFIEEFKSISDTQSFNHWINLLCINNSGRDYNLYYEVPVLSWISSEILFSKISKFPFNEQLHFVTALKERFGMKYINGTFKENQFPDHKSLKRLEKRYVDYVESLNPGNIENYKLKVILKHLQELIEYCNGFLGENSDAGLKI